LGVAGRIHAVTIELWTVDRLQVCRASDVDSLAEHAANNAAGIIGDAVAARGGANVMFATGNSQVAFLSHLTAIPGVAWDQVSAFHMDEYVGISANHPASFRRYIRERLDEVVHPRAVHYIDGSASDPSTECERYAALLRSHPLDLVCMGIGENGHLAFNDPPVANFSDPRDLKVVELDLACRRQQVGEGHFATVADVPTHAITVTIPALLRAGRVLVVCPDERKAPAVQAALEGPVTTACPASILREQAHAVLYLDSRSAAQLSRTGPSQRSRNG
jgi:glucosamine-6-phosphate deaminase